MTARSPASCPTGRRPPHAPPRLHGRRRPRRPSLHERAGRRSRARAARAPRPTPARPSRRRCGGRTRAAWRPPCPKSTEAPSAGRSGRAPSADGGTAPGHRRRKRGTARARREYVITYARQVGSVANRTACFACSGGTSRQRSMYACASSAEAPSAWIISAASSPTVPSGSSSLCDPLGQLRVDLDPVPREHVIGGGVPVLVEHDLRADLGDPLAEHGLRRRHELDPFLDRALLADQQLLLDRVLGVVAGVDLVRGQVDRGRSRSSARRCSARRGSAGRRGSS